MPDEPLDPDIQAMNDYYLALGRFIQYFVNIEAGMQYALMRFCGMTPEASVAVFSGVRVDQAVSFIRRLHEARRQPLRATLATSLDQLLIINQARNDIVHHGAQFPPGRAAFVTTMRSAVTFERARSFPVSAAVLNDMTLDLQAVAWHVGAAADRHVLNEEDWKRLYGEEKLWPWRYRRPSPKPPDRKPRSRSPKGKR